jgi:Domain of unknown function (DUF4340)
VRRAQLAILILLVVVLGAAAWLLARRSTSSWKSSTGHLPEKVVSLPINEVAQVTIQQPKAQIDLKQKGDAWVVAERADYPANFEMVSTFIRKVWELKPVQGVKIGPSQLSRLSLVEPGAGSEAGAGTLVDFKDANGKRLAAILFGKKYMRESNQAFSQMHSFPAGRYVMPENGSNQVLLVSDAFQQIDEKPEQWLDRSFIRVVEPISVTMAGTTPAMNWKLERAPDSQEWKLADTKPGEQLDATKARQVTGALGSISSFTDVLASDAKPETTGLDKATVITVNTEDGFAYVLKVGRTMGESCPVTVMVNADIAQARTAAKDEKPEQKTKLDKEFQTKKENLEKKLAEEKKLEGRIFLVPKFGIEQLEKSRADLLAPKATPTPRPSPTPKVKH